MKIILIVGAFLMLNHFSFLEENKIILSGKIEYEKTSNMYVLTRKMFDRNSGVYAEDPVEKYKRTQPQFMKLKSELIFNKEKELFVPIKGGEIPFLDIETPMAEQKSIVYTDFKTKIRISQKNVFEKTYLISEGLAKIKWKITNETKEIAGFTCRRANGIILDSIYVVAFYTNRIPISGGPESFSGLPGMILGVAIPHENINWFATKVTEANYLSNQIESPKIGQKIETDTFHQNILSLFKNKGSNKQFYLKSIFL